MTLSAAVGVLVRIGVVMAILTTTSNERNAATTGGAGDAVRSYPGSAVDRRCRSCACTGSGGAASRKFLTDEVLKRQIAKWPVSNIAILEDSSVSDGDSFGLVRAAANFGDQRSEGQIPVEKTDDGWKLSTATIGVNTIGEVTPGGPSTTLVILDEPLGPPR